MSNPAELGAIEQEQETLFGEDVTTFANLRLPIRNAVDASGLMQGKIDSERTEQYRNAGSEWLLAGFGGSFKTRMFLPGHGSSTSGATALTAFETLLGQIFGNADVSAATGTTFSGGGTAAAPVTVASGTFGPGSGGFAGVLGDGRGNGQPFFVATHAATTLNLLTALNALPSAADVCFSGVNIYPSEDPTANTVQSHRMRLLTPNYRYECHGVVPTQVELAGFNPGEYPEITVTWAPSWWRYTTATFPSTLATDTTNPGMTAAGSLFLNTVVAGVPTAARLTRSYRNLAIKYTLGMELLKGPGGVNAYQTVISARRTPDQVEWSWTEDNEAATVTPDLPGKGTAGVSFHAALGLSTAAGSRLAIYSPFMCMTNVPPQRADQNLNRLTPMFRAYTGKTTTSARTLSAMRMLFG
jgi:hypothetical protein